MRLLLAALLLLGGPAQAQDAAFDALAELFTRDAPTDEAAAKALPERGETLARLTADLTLAAQGLEAFRSPDDTTKALKYAPERVPAELRPMFSSRERALDTLYRTLAVANNPQNLIGKDSYGNHWYSFVTKEGKQVWVQVRKGLIRNGGINDTPRTHTEILKRAGTK